MHFDNEDLVAACDNVVAESLIPDRVGGVPSDPTCHADHVAANGWYSEQVLAEALRRTFQFSLSLRPLHANPHALREDEVVGAIANQAGEHGVALKRVDDAIWLLDSNDYSTPRVLSEGEYLDFIRVYPNTFPILRL